MKLTALFYLSSFCLVGFVSSQILSQCAFACGSQAAVQDGCVSITNITCVCTNAQFQEDVVTCLTALCPPSDLNDVQSLQEQECGNNLFPTGTPTNTETFIATGISSGTGTSLSFPSNTALTGSATTSPGSATSPATSSGSATSPAASSGSATSLGSATSPSTGNVTAASGSSGTANTPSATSGGKKLGVSLEMCLGIVGMLMARLLS